MVDALTVRGDTCRVCRKPKMKFSEYMDRELPALREDKPGLKAPQYKVHYIAYACINSCPCALPCPDLCACVRTFKPP